MEASERVHLQRDPLVRVVAQIQFSPVLSVRDRDFIASFQEAIRKHYPLVEKDVQQQVGHDDQGALEVSESVIWRFQDVSDTWQVSLSEAFVSLDCDDYSDRIDFRDRLSFALDAVDAHIRPVLATRVGVRYTNRFRGQDYERLRDFVRPELLGLMGRDLPDGKLLNQLTQAEFATSGINLVGRWGSIPPNTTPDSSIKAINEQSWLLDLDAFVESVTPFDAACCALDAREYAAVVYNFFRWAVSDDFLLTHGAPPQESEPHDQAPQESESQVSSPQVSSSQGSESQVSSPQEPPPKGPAS